MANSNILKPGNLFFLTERGIAQSLVPVSPVQKIEALSTGSFAGHATEESWSIGTFNGWPRKPTPHDPLMLVRDYSWISVTITNEAMTGMDGGFPLGSLNSINCVYTSAALIVALFGDKKVAFAVWLKANQALEDLVVPWNRMR